MKGILKSLKSLITLICSLLVLIILLIVINRLSNDLFQNMFKKLPWVQSETKTNTSITAINQKSEIVTARMNLDFINQLEGNDGRYIEILTYEVTAGINQEDNFVKVLHSDQKDAIILRDKIGVDNFDSYANPVKQAYEQKAKDYAVTNGILKTAKEKGEKLLKDLSDSPVVYEIPDYFNSINLPGLPLKLQLADSIFTDSITGLKIDEDKSTNQNRFMRDSLVLRPADSTKDWSISIGDTGMTFTGSYKDFYQNIKETNTNKQNSGLDKVELFRYFNPQNPQMAEVVSYASDFYRTFFVLKGSRIYYINANFSNLQELSKEISPIMIYLAASLESNSEPDLYQAQYKNYIQNYYRVSQNLRENLPIEAAALSLFSANVANGDRPLFSNEDTSALTPDEKLFHKLYNLQKGEAVCKTEDEILNNNCDFCLSLKQQEVLKLADSRNLLEEKLNQLMENQNLYRAYLYAYFLQNQWNLQLTQEEMENYKKFFTSANTVLINREAIIDMSYEERNEYFKNVFTNRLKESRRIEDTSDKALDLLPTADLEENKFLYFDVDKKLYPPEEILKEINLQNKGHKITECFILVFRQTEWNWGNFFNDSDIHALVLDDATLRIFPNVANNNLSEAAKKKVKAFFSTKNGVPFYYYGDWEKLQINPTTIKINGQSFETRRPTKTGRSNYLASNEYAELSALAQILSDIQHAYYLEEPDYYIKAIQNSILEEMSFYVYQNTFRPSPRLKIDKSEDQKRRYNW